ncbi:MAG TPA: hypothetical protein VFF68_03245, partial [Anaerolineaceae bacterium]|nr:hypothetical protein [Anaerolineaceae bacterium]
GTEWRSPGSPGDCIPVAQPLPPRFVLMLSLFIYNKAMDGFQQAINAGFFRTDHDPPVPFPH